MDTQIKLQNLLFNKILLSVCVVFLAAVILFTLAPAAEAKDAAIEKSRVTITINQPTASYQSGRLTARQSGESSTPRLRITPVETEDGRIRVIVPTDDLSEGTNIISVPARLMDPRGGETGGKLQAR